MQKLSGLPNRRSRCFSIFIAVCVCVLYRVLERSDANRMTTQNIGIVFGPTLMRPERDNGNMAVNMVYQNQAVELILSQFDHIFGTRGLS